MEACLEAGAGFWIWVWLEASSFFESTPVLDFEGLTPIFPSVAPYNPPFNGTPNLGNPYNHPQANTPKP